MTDTTCYIKAVGLASCACPCAADTAPNGWNESDSGLYVADLAPLDALSGLDDCSSPGNPWTVMAKAREQAIKVYIADTNAMLARRTKPRRIAFSGTVGETFARDTVTPTLSASASPATYAGLRIRCAQVKDGKLVIEQIGGVFNQTGNVVVRVYDRYNRTVGDAITIAAVAGQHVQATANITLPLWDSGSDFPEYFLAYQVTANLPRATRIHCGCGGFNPEFNCAAPYFRASGIPSKDAWANWCMIGAWGGSNLTDFDLAAQQRTTSNITNGLTLTLRTQCDVSDTLCSGTLNFSNPLALSIAHAIRYKTAELTADALLLDTRLNRQAIAKAEALREQRKVWQGRYSELVNYVTAEADLHNSDCAVCKSVFDMQLAGIFS